MQLLLCSMRPDANAHAATEAAVHDANLRERRESSPGSVTNGVAMSSLLLSLVYGPRTKRLLTPPTSKPSLLRMLLHNHLSIFRLKSASSSLTSSFGREARQQQHKMLFEKVSFADCRQKWWPQARGRASTKFRGGRSRYMIVTNLLCSPALPCMNAASYQY